MGDAAIFKLDPFDRPDEFGRPFEMMAAKGSFDSSIDAGREALARDGRRVDKFTLTLAFRKASGLGWWLAWRAVEGYFAREGELARRKGHMAWVWVDDLCDTECAIASKRGRTITGIFLIKTLRAASGLDHAAAKLAVEDYYVRRGALLPAVAFTDLTSGRIDDFLDDQLAAVSREDWAFIKVGLIYSVSKAMGVRWSEARPVVEDYLTRKVGDDLPRIIGPAGPMGVIAPLVLLVFSVLDFFLSGPLGPVGRIALLVMMGLLSCFLLAGLAALAL